MAEQAKDGFWETFKTVFWALVIAGIIRTIFFQPFWIPSSSMKPTLLIGDFLFVNKMAYGYTQHSCPFSMCPFIDDRWLARDPERGDIVVFKNPLTQQDFIKRLIGVPGDTIEMRDGQIILNGAPIPQEPDGAFVEVKEEQGPLGGIPLCRGAPVGMGGDCSKDQFVETLPDGQSYNVLNIFDNTVYDTTGIYTVPPDNYFFMGDNRDNSLDSRAQLGFVEGKYLIGRADRVIFSSAGRRILFFWTWRGDRFFESLN
ncbi:MAG: signal peptidase I [Pseudomonadota bacterium]